MDGKKRGTLLSVVAAVVALSITGGCSSMNANLAGEKVSRGEKAVADAKESSAILKKITSGELDIAIGIARIQTSLVVREVKRTTALPIGLTEAGAARR